MKYYPVPADQLHESGASDLEMVDACLLKWSGLTREVLDHYGLKAQGRGVYHRGVYDPREGKVVFFVDSDSCALCARYLTHDGRGGNCSCDGCPINESRGMPCDKRLLQESVSPYGAWHTSENPQPMISALEDARRFALCGRRISLPDRLEYWLWRIGKKLKQILQDAL